MTASKDVLFQDNDRAGKRPIVDRPISDDASVIRSRPRALRDILPRRSKLLMGEAIRRRRPRRAI